MDYCSTCRRHLNGALVCPGCGAYAPDIAPGVVGGDRVPGAAATTSGPATGAGDGDGDGDGDERRADAGWFTSPARSIDPVPLTASARPAAERPTAPERSADAERPAGSGPVDGSPRTVPSSSGTGRAARRRQLARWRKTQRRALVATAVALVGGGITLASTDRGGGERAQAATAPDLRGMGGTTGTTDDGPPPGRSPDRTTAPRRPTTAAARSVPGPRRPPPPPRRAPTPTAPPPPKSPPGTGPRHRGPSPARAPVRRRARAPAAERRPARAAPARPPAHLTPPSADDGERGGSGDAGDGGSGATQPAPGTPPPSAEPEDPRLCLLLLCIG
ncbi:SCO2400 family protein [Streptomyces tendae]|uniref:SCO2400 family protein n=1 Tax=Streptomyces tendae TaxID=1932 RepID=UPI00142EF988|nr:hypothetical protein [Streptomyces tendae]